MKLYYSPGACSLAPHIVIHELGLPHDLVKVDLKAHKTEKGEDYYKVVPKGYVPTLELDSGEQVSETVNILLYLAGLKPEKKLAVLPGDRDFHKQLEALLLVTTEFHKGLGVIAWVPIDEASKDVLRQKLSVRLDYVDALLGKEGYLFGKNFSVADAYLFTILNWAKQGKVDLSKWKNVAAYYAKIGQRPAVQAAMKMEGLVPASKAA